MDEWMYRSKFSSPGHALAVVYLGKEHPVPIKLEAVWAPDLVWATCRREKIWSYRDSNSVSSVLQPAASRCTDYAVSAPNSSILCVSFL
jgi:hypothetical protein